MRDVIVKNAAALLVIFNYFIPTAAVLLLIKMTDIFTDFIPPPSIDKIPSLLQIHIINSGSIYGTEAGSRRNLIS